MRQFLFGLMTIISLSTFGQGKEERILYVVDSVAIMEDPKENDGNLSENEVETMTIVTDKAEIEKQGYKDYDKLIYIITKEYAKRPEEIKRIPSFNKMVKNTNKWSLIGASTPYSGPFIDYYYNGKKKREGFLKDGRLNGFRTSYYLDGQKKSFANFSDGNEDGEYLVYFTNGQLQQQEFFKDGKPDGLWKAWYSTGILKNQMEYKNGKTIASKEDEKIDNYFTKGTQSQQEGNYKAAIKFYNKAIELNPNFSELYFHRSRAYLYDLQFDQAIIDCNKAIEIEPLYKEAYSNRAFTRIRKFELSGNRVLSKNSEITVLAGKNKTEIPADEKEKICNDLKRGFELGDTQAMIKDAIKEYCK